MMIGTLRLTLPIMMGSRRSLVTGGVTGIAGSAVALQAAPSLTSLAHSMMVTWGGFPFSVHFISASFLFTLASNFYRKQRAIWAKGLDSLSLASRLNVFPNALLRLGKTADN